MITKSVKIMAFFLTTACVSAPSPSKNKTVAFEEVEKLSLGTDTKSTVRSKLGAPDKVFNRPQITTEAWQYMEAPFQNWPRATLEFDPDRDILISVYWQVRDDEPLRSLNLARKHFPNAKFKKAYRPPDAPDIVRGEPFYQDEKMGIAIDYSSARDEVNGIAWFESASRKLTSTPQTE